MAYYHTHTDARKDACTHTHSHARAHTRTKARTHAHTRTHTQGRTHTRTNAHTHTRTNARARAHTRTHTHTHTHTPLLYMNYCWLLLQTFLVTSTSPAVQLDRLMPESSYLSVWTVWSAGVTLILHSLSSAWHRVGGERSFDLCLPLCSKLLMATITTYSWSFLFYFIF